MLHFMLDEMLRSGSCYRLGDRAALLPEGAEVPRLTVTAAPGRDADMILTAAPLSLAEGLPRHTQAGFTFLFPYERECISVFDDGTRIRQPSMAALLLPPGTVHRLEPLGREGTAMLLQLRSEALTPEVLAVLPEDSPVRRFFAAHLAGEPGEPYLYFGADNTTMNLGLRNILCEYYDPDAFSTGIIRWSLPLTLLYCQRALGQVSTQAGIVDKVVGYISGNYAATDLNETAERFGYSPDHLSRLLRRATGRSFIRLKQEAAMRRGAYLLSATDLSVREVAELTGIHNPGYFYKLFSREYGCSPNVFRQRARSGKVRFTEADWVDQSESG